MRRRFLIFLLVTVAVVGIAGPLLYEKGFIHLNYPKRWKYPVRGIDVSVHQGEIDWNLLIASTKIDFAFVKASEGARLRDHRFAQNWSASQGKIARGAYHFFTFCSPGDDQAKNFLSAASRAGELPPAVDIEFAGNCRSWTSIGRIRSELRTFLDAVESGTGRTPILYVTRESFGRIVRGHFDGYPLWVREVVFHPSITDYPKMVFWQYAGNGRARGIRTLVDLNAFVGTRRAFESLTGS